MPPKKKTEVDEQPVETDVDTEESNEEDDEKGVRENNPAGVHDALKGPSTADLNPAFR